MEGYLCNLNLATHHFETSMGYYSLLRIVWAIPRIKRDVYIERIAPKIKSLINGNYFYQSSSHTWGHDVKDNSKSKKSLEPDKGHFRMP